MGILQNLFRNVGRGSSTNGTSSAGARGTEAAPNTRSRWYVVVTGDSLSTIAKREYGDANDWPKIYWANRKIVKSPTLIHAGQVLRIP
ncbi:MAG TPA: LysM peptidoglycan-binding domain-containing protein [Vicinamibacteria bacterium]|jgi:nucleoid-associated protein YgaU